jgi:hypothetical protein
MFNNQLRVIVAAAFFATLVSACGGGDEIDNTPLDVSKTVATFDLTGTATLHSQQLAAAGAVVKSTRCYRSASTDVIVGPPPIMFVYEVRTSDAAAATGAGFQANASRTGFSVTSIPCLTPEGTPAV